MIVHRKPENFILDIRVQIKDENKIISTNWYDLPSEMHTILANFIDEYACRILHPIIIVYQTNIFTQRGAKANWSEKYYYGEYVNVITIWRKHAGYNPYYAQFLGHELGHTYLDDYGLEKNNELNADLFAIKLGCTPNLDHYSGTDINRGLYTVEQYKRELSQKIRQYNIRKNIVPIDNK